MATSRDMKSIRLLGQPTEELLDFVREWDSVSPGITAHTSGSTGKPKEILLSRDDMLLSARATCRYFGIGQHSILGLPLSASYIAGKMMAVRALVSGASLYIETPANRPLEVYSGSPISLLSVVPSQLHYLLESGRLSLVEKLLVGGSPLPASLESALLDAGCVEAYVSYGMTETCSHVALRRIGCDIYEALPGTEFSLDDRGCLAITTAGTSYSPVVTNDMAEVIDSIHFRWLGRFDNVVISGGLKLMPEVIEKKIASAMDGAAFVLYGRPSEMWGQELVMLVEADTPVDGLHEKLRAILPPAELPKEILFTPRLERVNGKIIRPRT